MIDHWITVCKACNCIHDGRHISCPECGNAGDRHVLWQQPVNAADERMYPRVFIGPMGDGGIYEEYMPGPRWK